MKDSNEAQDVVNKLSHLVNDMSFNPKEFVSALSYEHRTLQQGITGSFIAWFIELARMKITGRYDLRNEASVKMGYEFVEKILCPMWQVSSPEEFIKTDGNKKRYLPFI